MANVHLDAPIPNFDVLEYHAFVVKWWNDLVTRSESLIEDGYIEVSETPRLGAELDRDAAKEYATEEESMFTTD